MTFKEKVLKVVAQIPQGEVMTYKEVATKAGSPRACRAVGNFMNKNRNPKVPCHRVVGSNGWIGGFAFGVSKKIKRLKEEGANLENFKI